MAPVVRSACEESSGGPLPGTGRGGASDYPWCVATNPTSESAAIVNAPLTHSLLAKAYPEARCELDFTNPLELLVATVLSAQSTDRRVNAITPRLFAALPTAAAYAEADPAVLEDIIRPTGFFRAKATSLIGIGRALVEHFDGVVPGTLEELVTLPGVGRKTANVVLGNAFGVPGITPDTHFMRVTHRLGWTSATKPDAVEASVGGLFPPEEWVMLCHRIIWHGRRRCHAQNPACGACPVADLCPSFGAGETDPVKAERLVREPRR